MCPESPFLLLNFFRTRTYIFSKEGPSEDEAMKDLVLSANVFKILWPLLNPT